MPSVDVELVKQRNPIEQVIASHGVKLQQRLRALRVIARGRARREDRTLFRELQEQRTPFRKRLLIEDREQRTPVAEPEEAVTP